MTNNKVNQKIEALLQTEAMKKYSNRILLAVQTKDKTVNFRQCAGREAQAKTISEIDPFFIASITKMMTATVILQLIDEGKLSLDDPLSQHLPSGMIDKLHVYKRVDYSSQITIHQLLHQTSGLADYFLQKDKATGKSVFDHVLANEDHEFTRQDYFDKVREMKKPMFAPSAKNGTRSFYSDTNYQLLGAIMEVVTEQSIAENFEQRIFQPLQLSESTYLFDHKQVQTRQRQPIPISNQNQTMHVPKIMSAFESDGAVVSTLNDMLVFLRAYFDSQLFDPQHHEIIQQQWNTVLVPPLQYGLGLMRFKVPKWMTLWCFDMPPLFGHSGSSASFAFYAPHKEAFIVGSFNQIDQESRPFQFMMQVLNCLEG